MTGDVVETSVSVEHLSILFVDIETSPMVTYSFSTMPKYIPHTHIIHDSFKYCWAARYRDQKTMRSDKLTPEEVLAKDDSRIIESLAELVREADIVVAHNGDRFDLPELNTSLVSHGLDPVGPVQTIDTLKLVKKSFRFPYNKQDYISKRFNLGGKHKTDFELWDRVYQGDEVAMQQMLRYCRKDVRDLGDIFEIILPYVKGLPKLVRATGPVCPYCGSADMQKRGTRETNASTFQRVYCKNCKRYSRVRQSEPQYREGLRPL